jgi:predicted porin
VDEFATPDGSRNATLFSAAVNFDMGAFSALAAVDRREDAAGLAVINFVGATDGSPAPRLAFGATAGNPATLGSVDAAWKLGAGYELKTPAGATTLGLLLEQLVYQQDRAPPDAIKEYKRIAWQVAAKHRYGDHEVRARYDVADEGDCEVADGSAVACSTDGYGARQMAFGYAYHLAPSTQAYASYTRIINDDAASYTLTIGGAPAVAGATAPGADPQAIGVGVRFAF